MFFEGNFMWMNVLPFFLTLPERYPNKNWVKNCRFLSQTKWVQIRGYCKSFFLRKCSRSAYCIRNPFNQSSGKRKAFLQFFRIQHEAHQVESCSCKNTTLLKSPTDEHSQQQGLQLGPFVQAFSDFAQCKNFCWRAIWQ